MIPTATSTLDKIRIAILPLVLAPQRHQRQIVSGDKVHRPGIKALRRVDLQTTVRLQTIDAFPHIPFMWTCKVLAAECEVEGPRFRVQTVRPRPRRSLWPLD